MILLIRYELLLVDLCKKVTSAMQTTNN